MRGAIPHPKNFQAKTDASLANNKILDSLRKLVVSGEHGDDEFRRFINVVHGGRGRGCNFF